MYWCLTFKLHYSNFSPIPAFWFLHFEPTQNCTSERGKTKSVGKIIQFFDDFSRAWSVLKITEDLCSTERGDSFSLGALQIFKSCPSYSLHPLASLLCKNIEKPAQLNGHLVLHPGSGSAHVSKGCSNIQSPVSDSTDWGREHDPMISAPQTLEIPALRQAWIHKGLATNFNKHSIVSFDLN